MIQKNAIFSQGLVTTHNRSSFWKIPLLFWSAYDRLTFNHGAGWFSLFEWHVFCHLPHTCFPLNPNHPSRPLITLGWRASSQQLRASEYTYYEALHDHFL